MSKVAIAYIGPKDSKRDTITGSRQVFPRMKPIEVEESVAANLLRYDKVFVEAEKLEAVEKLQKEQEVAREIAAEKAAERAREEAIEADYTVMVGGEEYDLKKMNSPKIATLLEGADIKLEPKGAQENAEDYKLRVRDHIRSMTQE